CPWRPPPRVMIPSLAPHRSGGDHADRAPRSTAGWETPGARPPPVSLPRARRCLARGGDASTPPQDGADAKDAERGEQLTGRLTTTTAWSITSTPSGRDRGKFVRGA